MMDGRCRSLGGGAVSNHLHCPVMLSSWGCHQLMLFRWPKADAIWDPPLTYVYMVPMLVLTRNASMPSSLRGVQYELSFSAPNVHHKNVRGRAQKL